MTFKLTVATYNPLSIAGADRLLDIAQETPNFDVFALAGTQRVQFTGAFGKETVAGRLFVHAGYDRKAARANKSCGCGLLLGRKFKESNIVEVFTPPKALTGRGVAVHLRSCFFDLLAIVMYFPTRPHSVKEHPKYLATCCQLANWGEKVARNAKGVTSPLFSQM